MKKQFDVIVIGGGPAGLSAALYLSRAKYHVLVIEKKRFGGNMVLAKEIANYAGVETIAGKDLAAIMKRQAEHFGTEFVTDQVRQVDLAGTIKKIITTDQVYQARGVILATGTNPGGKAFKGETEFRGRGVAYCATCDGEFFKDQPVFVYGGSHGAAEDGLFLTRYAKKVTFIVPEKSFQAPDELVSRIDSNPKIAVLFQTVIEEVGGSSQLQSIRLKDKATGAITTQQAAADEVFGVFVFAGRKTTSGLYQSQVKTNGEGYLIVDRNQKTSLEGVYGAGDICEKMLRQVATAVSDGAVAATSLGNYLDQQNKQQDQPQPRQEQPESEAGQYLDQQIRQQLMALFAKMERKVLIRLDLDESDKSREAESFAKEIAQLGEKLDLEIHRSIEPQEIDGPQFRLYDENGQWLRTTFYGIPGGHEFNSFILTIYNAAGPGQQLADEVTEQISRITQPTAIKVFVTLSCTMCPETALAAQQLALKNQQITAEIYDLALFPKLKEKYKIMSVPCMVINDQKIVFGKKQPADILQEISLL